MKTVEIKKDTENRITVIFPYNSIYAERIKCQPEERIFNDVAYTSKFVGYPTLSEINELYAMPSLKAWGIK